MALPLENHLSPYRSHMAGSLTAQDKDECVRVTGWVHNKRDHGSLLFVDLRDARGVLQCVVEEVK